LAGILEKHRDKQKVFYSLKDDKVRRLADFIKVTHMKG
jgi:DNA-binding transcriptional ArsR family regulator